MLVSKALKRSQYSTVFRLILNFSKVAKAAFANVVQQTVQKEIKIYARNTKTFPVLQDTSSVSSFSWTSLLDNLKVDIPTLYSSIAGSMPNNDNVQ